MSGARVDEGRKMDGGGGDKGRGERDTEGVRVRKSGLPPEMHRKGQRSPQSVWRSEGCLTFFRVCGGLLLFGLGSTALSLGGGRG